MTLIATIIIVKPNIIKEFPCETLLKKLVILDYFISFILSSSSFSKFKSDGNKKNVTVIETIKPKVIIQPKSIIGFIPLNIKDKKAQIVVSTVYNIGRNIFLVVSIIDSFFVKLEKSFLICKYLTVI